MSLTEIVNHDGHRGDAMQAHTQWQHPVASNEALNVLHQAISPVSHRRIRMGIETDSNLPAFFVVVNSLLPTTIVK